MVRLLLLAATALGGVLASGPLSAQVGVRASTAAPDRPNADNREIIVEGQRRSVMRHLRDVIARDGSDQLARFEDKICPMVIGMPRDWTAAMTRMIRTNVESFGGAEPADAAQMQW